MNNDLISREALKKAFANSEHIKETTDGLDVMEMLAIKEIIDNAPTVVLNTNDIEYKAYCKGLEDGKKIARPQGEWIVFYTPKKKKVFKCDKCMAVSIQGQTNFCPNCGADMKGDNNG